MLGTRRTLQAVTAPLVIHSKCIGTLEMSQIKSDYNKQVHFTINSSKVRSNRFPQSCTWHDEEVVCS